VDLTTGVELHGDWTVVRVNGEVDIATAPRLREQLIELVADGHHRLVLDLDGVEFLDSTGLGVIVGALKRARSQGGDLRLVCTRPRLTKVFRLTALDRAMPLSATTEEAISAPPPAPTGAGDR
jgi:anti-sigma B factor antagonist